jgi:hypothetical protein
VQIKHSTQKNLPVQKLEDDHSFSDKKNQPTVPGSDDD